MGRPLRVARPVGLLAARRVPVEVPLTLGTLRLWQQCGTRAAARPTSAANQFRVDWLNVTTRQEHTDAKNTPCFATTEFQTGKSSAGLVKWNKDQLKFRFWDGEWNDRLAISPLWLRDSCPCHQCIDRDSGQKNFSTTDLPDNPTIEHAELNQDRSLKVVWAADAPSGGASHTTIFSADEVAAWQEDDRWQRGRVAFKGVEKIFWDRAAFEALLAEGRCRVSYKDWMDNESAFWDAFADLRRTGLIFVTDVPYGEKQVEQIANRIGPLQDTFYGRTWDVKSKPQAENVAYTSKFLGLHQDLMYHEPVPALQLLHCLSNSCKGGESLFSHGVRAAYELKITRPQEYSDLARLKSWFGYRKGQNHYFASRYTIMKDPTGRPTETRWAPPFQTTFQMTANEKRSKSLKDWKSAATAFQTIVESESNMFEMKLKEGECVIFDNRRILHGRRQFATGEGSRWLKGAYVSQQNYLAAATRMSEYMERIGMVLSSSWANWKEEQDVKASLKARIRASAPQPWKQGPGSTRTPEEVNVSELMPIPRGEQAPEPTQAAEQAQTQ